MSKHALHKVTCIGHCIQITLTVEELLDDENEERDQNNCIMYSLSRLQN